MSLDIFILLCQIPLPVRTLYELRSVSSEQFRPAHKWPVGVCRLVRMHPGFQMSNRLGLPSSPQARYRCQHSKNYVQNHGEANPVNLIRPATRERQDRGSS